MFERDLPCRSFMLWNPWDSFAKFSIWCTGMHYGVLICFEKNIFISLSQFYHWLFLLHAEDAQEIRDQVMMPAGLSKLTIVNKKCGHFVEPNVD